MNKTKIIGNGAIATAIFVITIFSALALSVDIYTADGNTQYYRNQQFQLITSSSDLNGIALIQLYRYDGNSLTKIDEKNCNSQNTCSLYHIQTETELGDYTYYGISYDIYGNYVSDNITINIINSKPQVTDIYGFDQYESGPVDFYVTATDSDDTIQQYRLQISTDQNFNDIIYDTTHSSNHFTWDSSYYNQQIYVRASAFDGHDWSDWYSESFIADNLEPTITIIKPQNTTYNQKTIDVEIQASDRYLNNMWFDINGQTYQYNGPMQITLDYGHYTLTAYADDYAGNTAQDQVSFTIESILNVASIECFDKVVVGHEQSCTIHVNMDGQPADNALVNLYNNETDQNYGTCLTGITGSCTINYIANSVGTFTVYATAEKQGTEPDLDKEPTFTYDVINEIQNWTITNLAIYNDSQFTNEDYTYYRGETFYLRFQVVDNNGNPVDNAITNATLISPPGGRADLIDMGEENGWYRYYLTISTTHDFLGESQVFTFAFNNGQGIEEVVNMTILNNPPQIINLPSEITINISSNPVYVINLSQYEYDIEDSGNNLSWAVSGVDQSIINVSLNNKILTITGISEGTNIITLTLYDLDNDYDYQDVTVHVISEVNRPPTVNILYPTENQTVSGTITIQGEARDEDVLRSVDIRIDNGSWVNVEQNAEGYAYFTYDLDTTTLTNGQHTITARAFDGQLYGYDSVNFFVNNVQEFNVQIQANPINGYAPLHVNFTSTVTGGETPYTYQWNFGDGTTSSQENPLHIYNIPGQYTATLTVTDNAGQTASDSVVINVCPKQKQKPKPGEEKIGKGIYIKNIRIEGFDNEVVNAGDEMITTVTLKNYGNKLKNVNIAVTVQDLGIRKKVGPFDIKKDGEVTRIIPLEIPYDVKGKYDVRITVSNDGFTRIKYRDVNID